MTITATPTQTVDLAADLAADFIDLAVFIAIRRIPAAHLPAHPRFSIRLTGVTSGERLAEVEQFARDYEVEAEWRDGMFIAERRFGRITLDAHHTPGLAFIDPRPVNCHPGPDFYPRARTA